MDQSNNLTDDTLAGANQLDASDGGAAVDNTLSLTELNQFLGKNFKDKSTALSALKETQSFVGRKLEAANPAPSSADTTLTAKVQSLEEEVFYSQNPQYKDLRPLINKMGGSPSEVVGTPEFQAVFEKAKVADEVQKTKSVVNSNARLGQTSTHYDDAVKVANATKSVTGTADVLAKGIIEEFGL